jgi:hypothetical protein
MRGWVWAACLSLALLVGCSSGRPDETPEGALALFIEKMADAPYQPDSAKEAFALLSDGSRKNITTRAERISMVLGRRIAPQELLAMGPMQFRFAPRNYAVKTKSDEGVTMTVLGDNKGEEASVDLVRPKGTKYYRVDLVLPEPAAKAEIKR